MQNSTSFQVYNASAGSGKTFTIVKAFLKILLTSTNPNKFQQILAVTFTNKAAGEMKERVIHNLNAFSKHEENDLLQLLCDETSLDAPTVFERSKKVLDAILQRYGSFNIVTIDSFTHRLIRTFAYDLQLPLNFEVELDAESMLYEAVDIVISKIGTDKDLTKSLVNFALQKMEDDKSWDISKDLKSFSKIILNENDVNYLKPLKSIEIGEFEQLRNDLQKENKELITEIIAIGKKGTDIIQNSGLANNDFYYSLIPNHFMHLANNFHKAKFFDQSKLKERIDEGTFYAKSKSEKVKKSIENMLPQLLELYTNSESLYRKKITNDFIINSLNPLAVLSYIQQALETLKLENNVLLNAEFNELISKTIQGEPAPFIYERLGEKFRYYFIDEMQDTSVRQWENLIPLVENAISSENELEESGELVLVGDGKQAIYRWRGGKAEQFIALSSTEESERGNPFYLPKSLHNLGTNFRSYSEIVDFNNGFFNHISQFLSNGKYRGLYAEGSGQETTDKIGGYVQLSFLEKEEDKEGNKLRFPLKVAEIITNLDPSFRRNEVCVLVRTKKQGLEVADYLTEKNIEIISSETLLIANSRKVRFIVDFLYYLARPQNKEAKIRCLYFLFDHLKIVGSKHHFFSKLIDLNDADFFKELSAYSVNFNRYEFVQLPFYEGIEYIIRANRLTTESDASIQFFLDLVFEFQVKKQGNLSDFLEYWEQKKDVLSIVAPEAENAVRIMTIHKAKGLEFPVVIFPYDLDIYRQIDPKVWYQIEGNETINHSLISYNALLKNMDEQGAQLYTDRREALELDNFNLLYVTLTRAKEQLYIIAEKKLNAKNEENRNHSSGLFINYLKKMGLWADEKSEFAFGDSHRLSTFQQEKSSNLIQSKFISSAWKDRQINIVAQSSVLWDSDKGDAIVYGNLIHELLSKISTENDIQETIEQYVFSGLISTRESEKIMDKIVGVVKHKDLAAYFNQNAEVFCERELMTSAKNIVIPDRLIFNGNKVTIIDYKTGKPEEKHREQVCNYGLVLQEMGYLVERKILVYINEDISVEDV